MDTVPAHIAAAAAESATDDFAAAANDAAELKAIADEVAKEAAEFAEWKAGKRMRFTEIIARFRERLLTLRASGKSAKLDLAGISMSLSEEEVFDLDPEFRASADMADRLRSVCPDLLSEPAPVRKDWLNSRIKKALAAGNDDLRPFIRRDLIDKPSVKGLPRLPKDFDFTGLAGADNTSSYEE